MCVDMTITTRPSGAQTRLMRSSDIGQASIAGGVRAVQNARERMARHL